MRRTVLISTTAIVVAFSSVAHGQDDVSAQGSADAIRLPTVSVIGTQDDADQLPGSGQILDTRDIREQNYDDVNRALRKVPGVYIREEDGFGLFPNISLRGVDGGRSAKVTIMEDGVLMAPAPYSAPAAYYRPTTGRMSGIEVLKGSSQIRYGPHTTGGVINYQSTEIPLVPSSGYVRSTYGSDRDLRSHMYYGGTAETGAGRFGYLLEGYFRNNDGFKTIDAAPDFTDRDRTGFTISEPMLKLSYEPRTSTYHRFELKLGHTDLDADETYLGLTEEDFAADPFRRYSSTRFDNIKTEQSRIHLRHTMAPTEWFSLTSTVYYNKFRRNWFKLHDVNGNNLSQALAGAGGGADLATLKGEAAGELRVRNNNRSYWSRGIQTQGQFDLQSGSLDHLVTLGVRYHQDQIRRFQRDDLFSQNDQGAIFDSQKGTPGDAGNRRQRTDALAVSLDDRITVGRWSFTPGVRYEHLDLETWEPGFEGEGTMDVWAAGGGVTYDATDRVRLFSGVHRGFSVPGPRAHIRSGLDEETSLAFEAGARYLDPVNAFRAEITAFRTDFNDLIVIDNIGGTGSGGTENVGDVVSQGVEVGAAYDPGQAFDLGFGIPSHLSFTFTDATIDGDSTSTDAESLFAGGRDGADVPYIPDYQISFGSGLEFDRWGVSFVATYVDEMFTSASNTSEQTDVNGVPDARFGKTDSHLVVDVSGRFEVINGVNLVGGVQNIFDREYVASRHPHGPRPGKPRFFWGGLEATF